MLDKIEEADDDEGSDVSRRDGLKEEMSSQFKVADVQY
jgi:hypothetical protein